MRFLAKEVIFRAEKIAQSLQISLGRLENLFGREFAQTKSNRILKVLKANNDSKLKCVDSCVWQFTFLKPILKTKFKIELGKRELNVRLISS